MAVGGRAGQLCPWGPLELLLLPPLLPHNLGPAGEMVAYPALETAGYHHVGDVIGEEDGGLDEGEVRVRLLLPSAGRSSALEARNRCGSQVH